MFTTTDTNSFCPMSSIITDVTITFTTYNSTSTCATSTNTISPVTACSLNRIVQFD